MQQPRRLEGFPAYHRIKGINWNTYWERCRNADVEELFAEPTPAPTKEQEAQPKGPKPGVVKKMKYEDADGAMYRQAVKDIEKRGTK